MARYNRQMSRRRDRLAAATVAALLPVVLLSQSATDPSISPRARQLHARSLVVDTHDDTTQRLFWDHTFDLGSRHQDGNLDIPRMREGGLDALFLSIWMPGTMTGPPAIK